eukprot:GHVU01153290.1.p1 GENE.GHVU01153290.1~~GHVU01153290.1.p1  ORF type:complete len:446 (-),score=41.22 GHVU01153290.1:970-2142(-)
MESAQNTDTHSASSHTDLSEKQASTESSGQSSTTNVTDNQDCEATIVNRSDSQKDASHSESEAQKDCNTTCTESGGKDSSSHSWQNSTKLLSGLELIDMFKEIFTGKRVMEDHVTIGLVGYPNVGKSSTINAILKVKKVPVSATPGRTKHFQTLFVDEDLMLCDCPGLVMPTFVSTKAHMVVNGILPIDQLRDYVSPVSLVAQRISRDVLQATYGILLPKPAVDEGEDPNKPPTAHELLGAYGYMRGYMTHKGIPDFQKSARHILKDYVSGRLLYAQSPPDVSDEDFEPALTVDKLTRIVKGINIGGSYNPNKRDTLDEVAGKLDNTFFTITEVGFGSKGVEGKPGQSEVRAPGTTPDSSMQSLSGKPWKKHANKHKKEKLRRIHGHLDA